MITRLVDYHGKIVNAVETALNGWFMGLFARFSFAAVLLVYFQNSASTKIGNGVFGFLNISDNAYFQILPAVMERYGSDVSQVPFFPYDLIVVAGTYAEILLPVLIVLGLYTRIAALGMCGFVIVQSYVDVALHGADETTVGGWFDRLSDSVILDQRLLWMFVLIYLVVKGAGTISLDHLLNRLRTEAT